MEHHQSVHLRLTDCEEATGAAPAAKEDRRGSIFYHEITRPTHIILARGPGEAESVEDDLDYGLDQAVGVQGSPGDLDFQFVDRFEHFDDWATDFPVIVCRR